MSVGHLPWSSPQCQMCIIFPKPIATLEGLKLIHSFIRYLLSIRYMPGTLWGLGIFS